MRKLFAFAFALIIATAPANAQASGKPLQISVSSVTVGEGKTASITISKSGGNGRAVTVDWNTIDGSAKAPGDYLARSGRNTLGSVPITVVVPTVDDAEVESSESFSVTAKVVSGSVHPSATGTVTIADNDVAPPPPPAATQTCPDGSVILATATCPAPPPPPPVASGWEPSPSLAGLPPIEDELSLSSLLVEPTAPGSAAPDVVGAFRFICNPGQVSNDDPIVFPGQPGRSHLHQYYGNTSADAFSTYASLRAKGDSTCMTVAFNRSAYWMAAMLDGSGDVVKPRFVIIYYKRRPATDPIVSDPANPRYQGKAVPLPNGLKFIFGYDMLTNKAPTGALWFNCQAGPNGVSTGIVPGHYASLTALAPYCPVGAEVGAVLEAPSCWDGKNLDSPNHRDHVGYASYGTWGYLKCDAAHPYVIASFTLGAWYIVPPGGVQALKLSSDAMRPSLPPGTTLHADFFMAWKPSVHDIWEGPNGCINRMLNCSAGILGNGFRLPGAQIRPDPNPELVPLSSIPGATIMGAQ